MQLWVKLTGLATNLPALALAARDAGADAVVMMGRFMALVPDLETLAPALGTNAAYGGPWALPIVCRFLAESRRAVGAGFPLLGTNGVRSGGDLARLALAGASAGEVMSVVIAEGFGALTRILDELTGFLDARDLTFAALIGRAADARRGYAEQPALNARWRSFVPPETLRAP
jgi:dihydroorotate dehydrogenase